MTKINESFILNLLLASGLFLAGMGVHTLRSLSEEIGLLNTRLAVIIEKVENHETRINRIEFTDYAHR